MDPWKISPYPQAFDWAFTIVHDADDAYSLRLAPLFQVFDRHRIKVSMTAFAFWADWANQGKIWSDWQGDDPFYAPKAVPLEHPPEAEFYRSLIERGHEVGLHTASDSHDTREEIQRAFEFFKAEFGVYPGFYVEHRDNLQNHQFQGADPASPYFITDLLNAYQPWVWIVSPSAIPYNGLGRYYDVLSTQRPLYGYTLARGWGIVKEFLKTRRINRVNGELYELLRRGGSPFDRYALKKYGLVKAFRRAGRQQHSDGDGFVEWFRDEHLDELERHNGLAIAYTHLNTRWLEPGVARMRRDLEQRFAAIASRNVWLATATTILDRFAALERLHLATDGRWLKIANANDSPVEALTIIAPPRCDLLRGEQRFSANARRRIVVGDIGPYETLVFEIAASSGRANA